MLASGRNDWTFRGDVDSEPDDVPHGLPRIGDESQVPSVFVWGDSHARAILPAVDAACKALGKGAIAATRSGTSPLLNWYRESSHRLKVKGTAFNDAVMDELEELIRKGQISTVILAGRWSADVSREVDGRSFGVALCETARRISEAGDCKIILVKEVPIFPRDVPKELALLKWRGKEPASLCISEMSYKVSVRHQDLWFAEVREQIPKIIIMNPFNDLRSPGGDVKGFDDGGSLYRDHHHLSTHGSMRLVGTLQELLLE